MEFIRTSFLVAGNKNLTTTSARGIQGRALYIDDNDDVKSVEAFALDWYHTSEKPLNQQETQNSLFSNQQHRRGGWIGVHDEGGLLRDIFAILMIDVLLDTTTIPDAFIVPTQVR